MTGPAYHVIFAGILLVTAGSAQAASGDDPTWPCIQRKVPELSLGQVWNGPDLPASARQWAKDRQVSDLVAELSARRIPLADAQAQIRNFAAGLPDDQARGRLTMLVSGLFEHMDHERSQVISGIGRYARKQLELAARLRKEAAEVDALRRKPDSDAMKVAALTDRLTWETRVFQERVQSLTYVCETPTLIEQRLYSLVKTVQEAMSDKP